MHQRQRRIAIPVGLLALVLWGPFGAARAGAQISPNGAELQVNSFTTGDQQAPAIATDGQGRFIVVWESAGSSGTDGESFSIQARRFDVKGSPLGAQFQVNSYTTSYQVAPAVAADPQGNFIVVWMSDGSNGTDISAWSIQGQRYDASGGALGSEFQVNTYTTLWQHAPAVASDALGNFVVAWQSAGSSGGDTDQTSIQAQRYAASGSPLGLQFQVNSSPTLFQYAPAVARDSQGDFVVVWQSYASSGTDSSGWSIQGQRYDASGFPLGDEFQINTYTTNHQQAAAVAMDSQGTFTVVWSSYGSSAGDSSFNSIQAQRYDASGVPLDGEVQVNSYTTGEQYRPAVGADPQGELVVTWSSVGSSGDDSSGGSVQGQRYDPGGLPRGGEFQVNTCTTTYQEVPAVTADQEGNFVVVWQSDGSSGTDASGFSIQAQRYDGLFRDGFESGDWSAWSSALP